MYYNYILNYVIYFIDFTNPVLSTFADIGFSCCRQFIDGSETGLQRIYVDHAQGVRRT